MRVFQIVALLSQTRITRDYNRKIPISNKDFINILKYVILLLKKALFNFYLASSSRFVSASLRLHSSRCHPKFILYKHHIVSSIPAGRH